MQTSSKSLNTLDPKSEQTKRRTNTAALSGAGPGKGSSLRGTAPGRIRPPPEFS